MEKGYYSIKEFCLYLGVSRNTVHKEIKAGRTRSIHYCGRVLIPRDWKAVDSDNQT